MSYSQGTEKIFLVRLYSVGNKHAPYKLTTERSKRELLLLYVGCKGQWLLVANAERKNFSVT